MAKKRKNAVIGLAIARELIELAAGDRYVGCRFDKCEFTGFGAYFERCHFQTCSLPWTELPGLSFIGCTTDDRPHKRGQGKS